MDDSRGNLGSYHTLINDLKFTTAGYDKLAIQTANREKAGSRLATLGRLSTGSEQNIATFSGATWDIIAVANPSTRNTSYIWNIVNRVTYPFLSWQPV